MQDSRRVGGACFPSSGKRSSASRAGANLRPTCLIVASVVVVTAIVLIFAVIGIPLRAKALGDSIARVARQNVAPGSLRHQPQICLIGGTTIAMAIRPIDNSTCMDRKYGHPNMFGRRWHRGVHTPPSSDRFGRFGLN